MKKKVLALGLVACLALSTTTMAFGADATAETSETISGTGGIEGYVEKDLFVFTAPTTTDLSFKIDPQELLKATNSTDTLDLGSGATAFSDCADGYGENVLFATDTATAFSTKSRDITVVNKGQFDIDVSVTAKVTGLTKDGDGGYDIKMVDDSVSGFDFGDETAIAMKITPSTSTLTDTTEAAKVDVTDDITYLTTEADGVTVKEKVAAAPDSAFTIQKDSNGYKYAFVSDLSTTAFNEIVFNLSGKVNKNANWKNFNADASKALQVELTYTVEKHLGIETVTDVIGEGTGFNFTALKSDLSDTPAILYVQVDGKWYDLSQFATVDIADEGKYFNVSVSNWTKAPADGTRTIRLTSASNVMVYEGTVTFSTVKTITDVKGADKGCTFTVLKSDLSDVPTVLSAQIDGTWYDLSKYATTAITDKGLYYEVSVANWTKAPDNGSRPLKLTSADGTTLYSGTVTFGA